MKGTSGPTAPSRLSRSTNRSRPPKRALVTAFYYSYGVPYVDVVLVNGQGRILRRVPILQAGGTYDTFLHVPILVGNGPPDPATSPHVLIIFDDEDAPAAIGLIPRQQENAAAGTKATVTPAHKDEPEHHTVNEFRYQQGAAVLGLTGAGGWFMKPGESGTIRMQLPRGGMLRVSEDGAAEDSVAVAGAAEEYVGRLAKIVNDQTDLINALLAALKGNMDINASTATKAIALAAERAAAYTVAYIEDPRGRFASKSLRVSAETVASSPVDSDDFDDDAEV